MEQANIAGGWNGLPFRLVPRWSENVWGTGVSQVARMAYEDRVVAILGSVDGSTTHLAEQVVAKARLPLVSPVATDESVNLAGVPWMFSVVPGDHLWAPALAADLDTLLGEGSFALVAATDHDSRLAAQAVHDALDRLGRHPAMRLDVGAETTDLDALLSSSGILDLSGLLLVAGPEDGARLLGSVREAGYSGAVFASPRLVQHRGLELAGESADGIRVPLLVDAVASPARDRFEQSFRERTGAHPDWAAAHTFDATRLLLDAIRSAGPSRASIRDALAALTTWQGISGVIEWDPTGQNRRPVTAIATVREGRLAVVRR